MTAAQVRQPSHRRNDMNKQTLFILIALIFVGALYMMWSKGSYTKQVATEVIPTMTATDDTRDIETDLNAVTITDEDEGFTDINSDLNSL